MVCCIVTLYCFFSSRRRHTRCALVTGVQTCALPIWLRISRPKVRAAKKIVSDPEAAGHEIIDHTIGEPDIATLSTLPTECWKRCAREESGRTKGFWSG